MKREVKPLNFWCHKILPLVYDDSLSYYEVLCKIKAKINELIEVLNGGITDEIKKYIKDIINRLIILYTYDEDNLRVVFGVHSTDEGGCDKHEYESDDETIVIVSGGCHCKGKD